MYEYSIVYLNGITAYVTATTFKDAILEAKLYAQRKKFSPLVKFIMDEEGTMIKNVNVDTLEFNWCIKDCGNQNIKSESLFLKLKQ